MTEHSALDTIRKIDRWMIDAKARNDYSRTETLRDLRARLELELTTDQRAALYNERSRSPMDTER
jgi:hypothetical protein